MKGKYFEVRRSSLISASFTRLNRGVFHAESASQVPWTGNLREVLDESEIESH